ncbi:MAG: DEAD/DEAH box helicase family protein [Deltaproteobacteria bacterium]|nr:DEAD/DEAH box helicase family protein [Deltaproteobacteria bacterium]
MAVNAIHIQPNTKVRIYGREDLGIGEVLVVRESGGVYQADVVFEDDKGRRLESVSLDRLEPIPDLWERLAAGKFDPLQDFLLKQLAFQFPLQNSGGELSNSRTDLLPHQILLTHTIVNTDRRRSLIADEVGLGKTIETGMIIRELVARGEANRVLVICPAGLIKNWRDELRDGFRLDFDILGEDFRDQTASAWERRAFVIASIDAIKRPARLERLLSGPRWDMIVFDEAHHLTRRKYGKKIDYTQNYRLAEVLKGHTRDLLFLSATPHQGDGFQFWSVIQLLDDQLFESPEAMQDHRGLLNRVMIRRTKREVTDALGRPIFMRRQVHSQSFPLAAKERAFYDKLTEYLREGYGVAGLGQSRTTSQQRAVGFVMATFQKIMSSSPRAIKQALRRRLLVLLARQQMGLESKRGAGAVRDDTASRIVILQDEMRDLAIAILGIPSSSTQRAEADAYIAQVKQRLARKMATMGETTEWALDSEEDVESAIYAEANIPEEPRKVRELLRIVPEGPDRKFETQIRAIEQIRREYPKEKFVIFTQYRETQEFLRQEMAKLYGGDNIAIIKGGPLEDKIAAVEAFWEPDGAQFLISTSAGGEGINLQVSHILFNYDLPWNPMAVEQRIGRIHRYGQHDTVQVYNLVAEDTVEAHIYRLLEEKLYEIAQTIGKVNPVTGEVQEDFRSEILGYLGSSPNYQELYKKALVDRDYRRTEREIAEAIEKARQASEALRNLAQDLESFNLEHYRSLTGQFSLQDLQVFFEKAILRLGGTILPNGETYRVGTPDALLNYPKVSRQYDAVTFDRHIAMRRRKVEFLGLGHPLVDALISYLQSSRWPGDVTALSASDRRISGFSFRYLGVAQFDNGTIKRFYRNYLMGQEGSWSIADERCDLNALISTGPSNKATMSASSPVLEEIRQRAETGLSEFQTELRANLDNVSSLRAQIVGMGAFYFA